MGVVHDGKKFCFAWFAPRSTEGADRAALLDRAKWPQGATISVSFLDGALDLRARVKRAAKLWTAAGRANLRFEFREDTNATDIRISFKHSGSWSLMGTDCRREKDVNKPTMNFGWLEAKSSDAEVRSVVLHEFGHALGLLHEHQSPVGLIHWNKERIYQDLQGPPHHWDKATIDANMFDLDAAQELSLTKFDPKSIMMYSFPASWTTDGTSMGENTDLSELDEKLIRERYP